MPNKFRTGTESIQKLEENMYKREEILPEDEKPNPPRFIVELKVGILQLKYKLKALNNIKNCLGRIGCSRSQIRSF